MQMDHNILNRLKDGMVLFHKTYALVKNEGGQRQRMAVVRALYTGWLEGLSSLEALECRDIDTDRGTDTDMDMDMDVDMDDDESFCSAWSLLGPFIWPGREILKVKEMV